MHTKVYPVIIALLISFNACAQQKLENIFTKAEAVQHKIATLTVSSYSISKRPSTEPVATYTYDTLGNLITYTLVHTKKNGVPTQYFFEYADTTLRKSIMQYALDGYATKTITLYDEHQRIIQITDSTTMASIIDVVTHTYYRYVNDTAIICTVNSNGDTTAYTLQFTDAQLNTYYEKNLLTQTAHRTINLPNKGYEKSTYKNDTLVSKTAEHYNAESKLTADINYYHNTLNETYYTFEPLTIIEKTTDSAKNLTKHTKTIVDPKRNQITTITYKGADSTLLRESLTAHEHDCACNCIHRVRYSYFYTQSTETLNSGAYSGDYIITTYNHNPENNHKTLWFTLKMNRLHLPLQKINYEHETITDYAYVYWE